MTVNILDQNTPDALVIPLPQNEALPELLASIASQSGGEARILQNDFRAESKELLVLYSTPPGRRFYLVGMGKKTGFADVQAALRSFCFRNKTKLPLQLGVDLRHFPAPDIARLTDAVVTGALLGLYDIGMYRSPDPSKPVPLFGSEPSELNIVVPSACLADAQKAARRGTVFATAVRTVLDFVNAAGNRKTPELMAHWAEKAGQAHGFSTKTLTHEQLRAEGLDALWQVGKGSPHLPTLILLEYTPKTAPVPVRTIGLVGKGVTFDTGGISLKPSANMHFMKSDLGGAAAVLGAFIAAAELQLPVRLVGAIPSAENMIDGQALKPGDVISSYSGKTIEVTDTDAEGRLILADALAWLLRHEKPEVLLDLATLTGSVIRALGNNAAGLFTQNNELSKALTLAGDGCGERLWPMPLWDEYGADLKSDVADLRNFTGKPVAESISAAKFLEHFTDGHAAWAHLDIAGTAFGDSEFAQGKSATGFGVRLLVEFVERWVGP